ncbi:hypothetical protein QFZ70_000068 [Arthrobacter sp. V1I9]|nr:hypothetical protein [Arthrobacter sp. V1I9]
MVRGAAEQRRVRDKALTAYAPEDLGFGALVKHAIDVTMRGSLDFPDVDEVPDLLRVRQP